MFILQGDHDHCCFFYLCTALGHRIKANSEIKNFGGFSEKDLYNGHVPEDVRNIGLKAFEIINNEKIIANSKDVKNQAGKQRHKC